MIIDDLRAADPRILRYAEDAAAGKDVCAKVQAAGQRFLNDLSRVNDPDYKWCFDAEAATKPIRFKEKFLVPTGNYEKFVEMPWQCFWDANVYGWKDKETGLFRFKKNLLIVGSGNGKTGLVGGDAVYDGCQLGIREQDVIICANSKEQADILFGDCQGMIKNSAELGRYYEPYRKWIQNRRNGTRILSVSTSPTSMEGKRPARAILDEYHAQRDWKVTNQIQRNLRKYTDSQMAILTTMGYVLDGPLVDEYRKAEKMLKGMGNPSVNDRTFALIYELDEKDDPGDENNWIKANPSLGVLLHIDDIRTAWEEAKDTPQKRGDILTKSFNIFTKQSECSFLDHELTERNRDMIDLESLRGHTAYGGLDVSSSEDHCSVCLEIEIDDARSLVLPHTFVPRRVAERDSEKLDYTMHQMLGNLTIIEGEYVRQEYIIGWFKKMREMFDILCIGYDPANATLLINALRETFQCEGVRQGALTLNPVMKHIREMYIDGIIVHNQNTLWEWYVDNVKLRQDYADKALGNWTPVKMDKFRKIDQFMAFADAHCVWMRRNPIRGAEQPEPVIEIYTI